MNGNVFKYIIAKQAKENDSRFQRLMRFATNVMLGVDIQRTPAELIRPSQWARELNEETKDNARKIHTKKPIQSVKCSSLTAYFAVAWGVPGLSDQFDGPHGYQRDGQHREDAPQPIDSDNIAQIEVIAQERNAADV